MVDNVGALDNTMDGIHGTEASALGTATAELGIDVEEKELLIRAGKVFLDDSFGRALALKHVQHLAGNALAQAATGRMVDKAAEQGDEVQIHAAGHGRFRRGEQVLHLASTFTAGNALATTLVAGEFVEYLESRENFWGFFHEETPHLIRIKEAERSKHCLSAQLVTAGTLLPKQSFVKVKGGGKAYSLLKDRAVTTGTEMKRM